MAKDPLLKSTNTIITSAGGDEYRRNREKSYNRYLNNDRTLTQSIGVFKIVFLIILMINIVRIMAGSGVTFTFTGLLNALQDAPEISTSWIFKIKAPSWLTGLPVIGDIINIGLGTLEVGAWATTGMAQIVVYFVWVLGFMIV